MQDGQKVIRFTTLRDNEQISIVTHVWLASDELFIEHLSYHEV